jgi:hypothetical protein
MPSDKTTAPRCADRCVDPIWCIQRGGCKWETTAMSQDKTIRHRPLEEDVVMDDGRVIRVMGLLAVKFRTDPDAIREFLEEASLRNSKETNDAQP